MATASRSQNTFPYTLLGINISLYLYRDRLIVQRKGYLRHMTPTYDAHAYQEIALSHIQQVDIDDTLLVLTLHDRDSVYALFAPQDAAAARTLARVLLRLPQFKQQSVKIV